MVRAEVAVHQSEWTLGGAREMQALKEDTCGRSKGVDGIGNWHIRRIYVTLHRRFNLLRCANMSPCI